VPETAHPDPVTPTFWQRRFIYPIAHQLTQGITPEKIALTLAVGSACALFPIFGFTTILCLIVGIVLKLNQPIIQLVNGICTPIHFPVIVGLFRLGEYLFGVTHRPMHFRSIGTEWIQFWESPVLFVHRIGENAWHAIVAWLILAPIWATLVYLVARPVLQEIVRIRPLKPTA
jgi:uncharacterized protein (DUF2062 family)